MADASTVAFIHIANRRLWHPLCGCHVPDDGAKPVRVSGIGARLTDDLPEGKINYGQLQVTFDDGSVGWYEAGWGPMMSENAFFIKDVVGPKGSLSIVAEEAGGPGRSADIESHAITQQLQIHHSELDNEGTFVEKDEFLSMETSLAVPSRKSKSSSRPQRGSRCQRTLGSSLPC